MAAYVGRVVAEATLRSRDTLDVSGGNEWRPTDLTRVTSPSSHSGCCASCPAIGGAMTSRGPERRVVARALRVPAGQPRAQRRAAAPEPYVGARDTHRRGARGSGALTPRLRARTAVNTRQIRRALVTDLSLERRGRVSDQEARRSSRATGADSGEAQASIPPTVESRTPSEGAVFSAGPRQVGRPWRRIREGPAVPAGRPAAFVGLLPGPCDTPGGISRSASSQGRCCPALQHLSRAAGAR